MSGMGVDESTGKLASDDVCSVNWEPVRLEAGSTITPHPGLQCYLWTYRDGFDESLVREYSYDDESNWTTPCMDLSPREWRSAATAVSQSCYARIGIRQADGSPALVETLGEAVDIRMAAVEPAPIPAYFQAEIDRVCARVEQLREPGDLALLVVSDIHYSTGCIWPSTARNIQAVVDRLHPQAIVQLGDVTDGLVPLPVTLSFVERVMGDLESCGVPVHCCIGNHDMNYFRGNEQRMSAYDCAYLFSGRELPWRFADFRSSRVRCIFLHSFNPDEEERYGYSKRQIKWLRRVLQSTPEGWNVLVFSHVTPTAEIHYWSETIRNGELLLRVLRRFDKRRGGAILGVVHGHNHADQVHRRRNVPFPIVSVGCAKFEDFNECKPEGSFTPPRSLGDASQDLWEVLVVKPDAQRLEFVRFGAGSDRSVEKHG